MTSTKSTHARLVWPRSDGDDSRWPTKRTPGPEAWFEPVAETHRKYDMYEEKAGEAIAALLGLPKMSGPKAKHRIGFPRGYKMFVHKQPRPNGEIREDFYVFGSKYQLRIRSAEEWKSHALWLFDTDQDLENHNRVCGCMRKKEGGGTPAPHSSPAIKRPQPLVATRPVKPLKKPKIIEPESDEDDSPTGVLADRASDLGSQRRFRRGELVYFRIETIQPPRPSLPPITHWPALIAEIRFKSTTTAVGGGSMAHGGVVHHFWEYHLRPLGMFDRRSGIIRDVKEMLPWSVGLDLFQGEDGRTALASEGMSILLNGIDAEVKADSDETVAQRWGAKWGKRIKFEDLASNWDEAAFRFVVAYKTGTAISKSWCQTDRIDVLPESILSEQERVLISTGKKGLFQGLWLGGERIWAEDVVRLKHHRADLPPGLTPVVVGSHAQEHAVFLRIQAIALESAVPVQVPVPGKEGEEATTTTTDSWRCLLYGDLAELVRAQPGQSALDSGWVPLPDASGVAHPLVQNYKAPFGYSFRQINTDDSQITCDIGDIAGRVYPDLVDEMSQTWYGLMKGRQPPGEKAMAVMGLRTGKAAAAENDVWVEDLFAIVDRASKTIESEFQKYYAGELTSRMGRQPGPRPLGHKAASAVNGNGAADDDVVMLDAPPAAGAVAGKPVSKGAGVGAGGGSTSAPASAVGATATAPAKPVSTGPPAAPSGAMEVDDVFSAPAPASKSAPVSAAAPAGWGAEGKAVAASVV